MKRRRDSEAIIYFIRSKFNSVQWYPLLTGLVLNNKLLKIQLTIIFIAVNLTFVPQHFLALRGIPRQHSNYPEAYTT